jgi:uncharacterized membrane protein YbhN (UPF0104 family)/tRNA A-37 threonylcarbamoyl transferase component Bud32
MNAATTYLISTEDQPRARRAADAVTLIIGLFMLFWATVTANHTTPLEAAIVEVVAALPSWTTTVFSLSYLVGALYLLVLLGILLAGGRARWPATRDVLFAMVGAGFLTVLLVRIYSDAWPYVLPELGLEDPDPQFPVLRVAVLTAGLIAASPHLARPMRRLGWVIVAMAAVAASGLGYGLLGDVFGAVGVGFVSAAAVLLIVGSPKGYPDIAAVKAALTDLGLSVSSLTVAPDQSWGVRRLIATTDTTDYEIKAYGRDATDSQMLAKAWRGLWYRDSSRKVTYSRLQGVEHEALVTVMAERAGASVPQIVSAAEANDEIALLVTTRSGTQLGTLSSDEVPDEALVGIYKDVARLHAASIAHGDLTTAVVRLTDSGHEIGSFTQGSLVADTQAKSLDVVELLFSLSLVVGVDRAVAAAVAGLGQETVVGVMPYLQIPAISTTTRKQAGKPKEAMKAIRDEVSEVTGEEMPPPARLRRVSWRNLLMAGLLFFAAYAFIPMIAGIDFVAVWDVLQNADWAWIVAALGIGHLVFIPEATGMMFAAGQSLPLWPLTTLQVSVKFIGLAVPSAAGRVTMNAAFLYKYGISAAQSITQGAIDGVSGFVVEAVILLLALIGSDLSLDLDLDTGDVAWGLVLLIIVLAAAGIVLAVWRISRLRNMVVPVLKEAGHALAGVLKRPTMALGLLGSNLAARLILAVTLWLILQGIGTPLSLGTCLVAVVSTNLLAGLVPIPGGIGIAETFMTGVLVLAGLDDATAFAATITYRMITFYLPAVEGFFAMRWLEGNGYL